MKKYIFLLVILAVPRIALSTENDDDFLLSIIPAIVAPQKCDDSSLLTTCHSPSSCEKAGGYWYEKKCNSEPYALREIRKLAGAWIFKFTRESGNSYDDEYFFNAGEISQNSSGEYQISGTDVNVDGRPVIATYVAEDVFLVEALEYETTVISYTAHLLPDYWAMSFVNKDLLAGVHASRLEFLDDPLFSDPAVARRQ